MAATEDRLNANLQQVADGIRGARGTAARPYLLAIMGDVEPVLSGPFTDDRDRLEAARDYRRAHGDEDGLYRVDATGDRVTVGTFSGRELEMPRHEWVSSAWVEGRNALILNDGWFTLEVYRTGSDGTPKRVGSALFLFWNGARTAGDKWTREGVWAPENAERVILEPAAPTDDEWQCPACYPAPCMHGQEMQDGGYC